MPISHWPALRRGRRWLGWRRSGSACRRIGSRVADGVISGAAQAGDLWRTGRRQEVEHCVESECQAEKARRLDRAGETRSAAPIWRRWPPGNSSMCITSAAGNAAGCVVRPPAVGATVVSVDEASVKELRGSSRWWCKKEFRGRGGQKPWQARAGCRAS